MDKPFAITLDRGSSRASHTGAWRTERPVYVRGTDRDTHQRPTLAAYDRAAGGQEKSSRRLR
jgi:hypothetical protein